MFSVEQLVANCLFNSLVEVRCYYNTANNDLHRFGSPFKDLAIYRYPDGEDADLWYLVDPIFKTRISEHLGYVSFNTGDDHALVSLYWAYVYMRDNVIHSSSMGEETRFYFPQVVRDSYPSPENPLPACFPAPAGYSDDYFTWNAIALLVMWALESADSPSGGSEVVRHGLASLIQRVVTPEMMLEAQQRAIALES